MSVRLQRARQAQALRSGGLTQQQVAVALGISRSYASALLTDPDGSRDRQRKAQQYGGTCLDCGRPTYGGDGPGRAPSYCNHCAPARLIRRWPRERIVEAIREWARRRGQAPTASDWEVKVVDPDGYEFPAKTTVYDTHSGGGRVNHPFNEWADAIEAAGFPRPSPSRNYNGDPWRVENMR